MIPAALKPRHTCELPVTTVRTPDGVRVVMRPLPGDRFTCPRCASRWYVHGETRTWRRVPRYWLRRIVAAVVIVVGLAAIGYILWAALCIALITLGAGA